MAYIVECISEEHELNIHQAIRFVDIDELSKYDFLPADLTLIKKLRAHYQEK